MITFHEHQPNIFIADDVCVDLKNYFDHVRKPIVLLTRVSKVTGHKYTEHKTYLAAILDARHKLKTKRFQNYQFYIQKP